MVELPSQLSSKKRVLGRQRCLVTSFQAGPASLNGVLVVLVLALAGVVVLFQNFWSPPARRSEIPPGWQPSSSNSLASTQVTLPKVTPRGQLKDDEEATIELFGAASLSVEHITTHALERDFFSFDVMEIPQGTGTGFVWDTRDHVVTDFHVIEKADTAYVALTDHSTWLAEPVGVAPDEDLAVLKVDAPSGGEPANIAVATPGTSIAT
jgi:S1-C subfamily serine protease